MSASPHVFNVTAENFKEQAIDASLEQPVLLYFWAEWCEPCKSLSPTLERLADTYRGAFRVAKIDCDQQQQLAAQLGVQSLPMALLIKDGQPVDQFMGAIPEGELRRWLDQYVEAPQLDPLEQGKALMAEGRSADAVPYLRAAQQQQEGEAEATLELARALLHSGEVDEAFALIDGLPADARQDARAQGILARRTMAEQAAELPPLEELEARLESDPSDGQARLDLSIQLVLAGGELEAMDHLLHLVARDRERREAAHQLAIQVLALLGPELPEARRLRQRLFQLLH